MQCFFEHSVYRDLFFYWKKKKKRIKGKNVIFGLQQSSQLHFLLLILGNNITGHYYTCAEIKRKHRMN